MADALTTQQHITQLQALVQQKDNEIQELRLLIRSMQRPARSLRNKRPQLTIDTNYRRQIRLVDVKEVSTPVDSTSATSFLRGNLWGFDLTDPGMSGGSNNTAGPDTPSEK